MRGHNELALLWEHNMGFDISQFFMAGIKDVLCNHANKVWGISCKLPAFVVFDGQFTALVRIVF